MTVMQHVPFCSVTL
jgi:hypothetical protein